MKLLKILTAIVVAASYSYGMGPHPISIEQEVDIQTNDIISRSIDEGKDYLRYGTSDGISGAESIDNIKRILADRTKRHMDGRKLDENIPLEGDLSGANINWWLGTYIAEFVWNMQMLSIYIQDEIDCILNEAANMLNATYENVHRINMTQAKLEAAKRDMKLWCSDTGFWNAIACLKDNIGSVMLNQLEFIEQKVTNNPEEYFQEIEENLAEADQILNAMFTEFRRELIQFSEVKQAIREILYPLFGKSQDEIDLDEVREQLTQSGIQEDKVDLMASQIKYHWWQNNPVDFCSILAWSTCMSGLREHMSYFLKAKQLGILGYYLQNLKVFSHRNDPVSPAGFLIEPLKYFKTGYDDDLLAVKKLKRIIKREIPYYETFDHIGSEIEPLLSVKLAEIHLKLQEAEIVERTNICELLNKPYKDLGREIARLGKETILRNCILDILEMSILKAALEEESAHQEASIEAPLYEEEEEVRVAPNFEEEEDNRSVSVVSEGERFACS